MATRQNGEFEGELEEEFEGEFEGEFERESRGIEGEFEGEFEGELEGEYEGEEFFRRLLVGSAALCAVLRPCCATLPRLPRPLWARPWRPARRHDRARRRLCPGRRRIRV